MTWNSQENLQRLRSCITALKLPPPPPAAVDGKITLQVLRWWSFSKAPFRPAARSGALKLVLFRRPSAQCNDCVLVPLSVCRHFGDLDHRGEWKKARELAKVCSAKCPVSEYNPYR